MNEHIPVARMPRKTRPAQRCRADRCAHLTRHRSQHCPDHRTPDGKPRRQPRAEPTRNRTDAQQATDVAGFKAQ